MRKALFNRPGSVRLLAAGLFLTLLGATSCEKNSIPSPTGGQPVVGSSDAAITHTAVPVLPANATFPDILTAGTWFADNFTVNGIDQTSKVKNVAFEFNGTLVVPGNETGFVTSQLHKQRPFHGAWVWVDAAASNNSFGVPMFAIGTGAPQPLSQLDSNEWMVTSATAATITFDNLPGTPARHLVLVR